MMKKRKSHHKMMRIPSYGGRVLSNLSSELLQIFRKAVGA